MTNATQTAQALKSRSVCGMVKSIEARTTDGKALTTLFRTSFEVSSNLDEDLTCKINEYFNTFHEKVLNLF